MPEKKRAFRKWFLLPLLLIIPLCLPNSRADWQKPLQPSLAGGPLTCLTLSPLDRSKFLIASEHQVFEGGSEKGWKELWSSNDGRATIQRLFTFPNLPAHVFVLAGSKIFLGNLKDHAWRTVYQDTSRIPLSFAVHPQNPNRWFLGTPEGLWETEDAGKTWFPSKVLATSIPVTFLFFEKSSLLIADEDSVYLAMPENPASVVFHLSQSPPEVSPESPTQEPSEEDAPWAPKIRDLISPGGNSPKIFLATESGVFESPDGGRSWTSLSRSGLESTLIYQLACSEKEGQLYAATARGVYAYNMRTRSWDKLFEGLAKDRTQSIAVLNNEKLIAITEEGFVQYPLAEFRPESGAGISIYQPPQETLSLFRELVTAEPSAREIHKRVIRYANVGNGKIKRWHAESRLASLLPDFSFNKSFSSDPTIDIDRGGTNDADQYIIGPRDVSKGGYKTLSWDLGEFIYSSDQTSIDSREKLMVELRNDLLSEATRIYYERRRLQIDIVFTPSGSGQEHLERLLRMDELTSLLDSMTDGFFSKRLERIYNERPEFNRLWTFQEEGVRSTAYGDKQQNKGE